MTQSGGTSQQSGGTNQQTRNRTVRPGDLLRVLIKVVDKNEWPSETVSAGSTSGGQQSQTPGSNSVTVRPAQARTVYARVTQRFCNAFNITPVDETYNPKYDPEHNRWAIPSAGGAAGKSFKFWKLENNKKKAYAAVMGSIPVYIAIKFARKLTGCIAVTSPYGRTYSFINRSNTSGSGTSGSGSGTSGSGSGSGN